MAKPLVMAKDETIPAQLLIYWSAAGTRPLVFRLLGDVP